MLLVNVDDLCVIEKSPWGAGYLMLPPDAPVAPNTPGVLSACPLDVVVAVVVEVDVPRGAPADGSPPVAGSSEAVVMFPSSSVSSCVSSRVTLFSSSLCSTSSGFISAEVPTISTMLVNKIRRWRY